MNELFEAFGDVEGGLVWVNPGEGIGEVVDEFIVVDALGGDSDAAEMVGVFGEGGVREDCDLRELAEEALRGTIVVDTRERERERTQVLAMGTQTRCR